ncbi:MAG: enolase C-terminal domain-like protein [Ilumatobacteraceae bacterium]|nr:enolase C-terminal domain-like protein [Ilumatobacteraceae bacterium]
MSPITIARIEAWPIEVPILPAMVISSAAGTHAASPFCMVRLTDTDGVVGYGEVSCTPGWSGEWGVTAAQLIQHCIAPAVVGVPVSGPLAIPAILERALAGNRFTKAAVEMAYWDIWGKRHNAPVHEMLGGPTKNVVRTKFSLTGISTDAAVAMAKDAVAFGYTAMKVKVARGPLDQDLERLGAVIDAVGPDVAVGVDANAGWKRGEAHTAATALAVAGAAFVEQPLPADDLDGMADLRRSLVVPLVADESVGTPRDAARVIAAGAADVLSIYVGMSGGLGPAVSIASAAAAAGLGWTIGSNMELGVATAAHIQLALGAPGLADDLVPCDIISLYYYDELLVPGLPVTAGFVRPTTEPGLGGELDLAAVDRYRSTSSAS